jgi:hypothetical protein
LGILTSRIFLLSPANVRGKRTAQLLAPGAASPLARALRSRDGASMGELFAFVSILYFRGKLTYARRFASPPDPAIPGVQIITPNAGLRAADTRITGAAVRAFAKGDIDADNHRYRKPLETSARALLAEIGPECDVVLLGSVASPKYVQVLVEIFGQRLRFPIDFVGRGDMSRGGLLLRKAEEGVELEYVPIVGAVLHGQRPPKLPKLPRVDARLKLRTP